MRTRVLQFYIFRLYLYLSKNVRTFSSFLSRPTRGRERETTPRQTRFFLPILCFFSSGRSYVSLTTRLILLSPWFWFLYSLLPESINDSTVLTKRIDGWSDLAKLSLNPISIQNRIELQSSNNPTRLKFQKTISEPHPTRARASQGWTKKLEAR
jgi:hypothetical protein